MKIQNTENRFSFHIYHWFGKFEVLPFFHTDYKLIISSRGSLTSLKIIFPLWSVWDYSSEKS